MNGVFYLAWQHLRFFKYRSAILVLGLTLTFALPIASHLIITKYGESLRSRANTTPYVLGASGNRFDLVLKSLYFGDAQLNSIAQEDVDQVNRSEWATALPLHLEHSASDTPIIGISEEYFAFRNLHAKDQGIQLELGDIVVGAEAADALKLSVGDRILSDRKTLYNVTGQNPVNLKVVAVLEPTGTADDRVLFSNLKTTWLLDGLMHGHPDPQHTGSEDPHNQGISYHEVTTENRASFHLHAYPAEIPISAAIVIPKSEKGATILEARYETNENLQLQNCTKVVEKILGMVIRIKSFFDAYYLFVLIATLLFVGLIVALSSQLRKNELDTMRRIGASRWFTFRLQATELLLIVALAGILSAMVTLIGLQIAEKFLGIH